MIRASRKLAPAWVLGLVGAVVPAVGLSGAAAADLGMVRKAPMPAAPAMPVAPGVGAQTGWVASGADAAVGAFVVPAPAPPPPIFYYGDPYRVFLYPAPGPAPQQCWVRTDPRGHGYWWPC